MLFFIQSIVSLLLLLPKRYDILIFSVCLSADLRTRMLDRIYSGSCLEAQTATGRVAPHLSPPFLFQSCHFLDSGWSAVGSIKSVMRCKWDANPSQRSGLLKGGYLMSAFKREPIASGRNGEKNVCVFKSVSEVCRHTCACVLRNGEGVQKKKPSCCKTGHRHWLQL